MIKILHSFLVLNLRSLGIVQHGRVSTLWLDLIHCTMAIKAHILCFLICLAGLQPRFMEVSFHSLMPHLYSAEKQRTVTCTTLCVLRCRSWWSQEDEVSGESIPGIPAAPAPVSHGFSPRLLLPPNSELRPFRDYWCQLCETWIIVNYFSQLN